MKLTDTTGAPGDRPDYCNQGRRMQMMEGSRQKVALFIDWANARGADFRQVVQLARELGSLEFAAAYGAWGRPETREDEKLFLALGIDMVHCPRWPVGRNPGGTTRFKCSDDPVLHRDLMCLLWTRPMVTHFVLVGADADLLASAGLAQQRGSEVMILHHPQDGSLGHVMRLGNFRFQELPLVGTAARPCGREEASDRSGIPFGELPSLLIDAAQREHNGDGGR
jgi:hypothetical protein